MRTETIEITKDLLESIIKNIPKEASSGELIKMVVHLLKTHENASLEANTIKKMLTNPPSDVAEILAKIDRITKTVNTIKAIIPERISYGKGIKKVTIAAQNAFIIKKLDDDLIEMEMVGVSSGLLMLSKVRIYPEGIDIYTGKLFGWKNVIKFN